MQEGRSETTIQIEEQSQLHCKICYLKTTPLLRLCACKGSIGFVHEDCMLRWITLKLERMSLLEIPACQLCKAPFAAELKSRRDKLSVDEVVKRVKLLTLPQILVLVMAIFGAVMLPYVEFIGASRILEGKVNNYLTWAFTYLVFPYYFGRWAYAYFGRVKEKWKECHVRQVEIFLLPKQIYR